MIADDIILQANEKLHALIVHSTEDDLGQVIASEIRCETDPNVTLQIERASDYSSLITILEKADPFSVFILIAHGDKESNSAWLFADGDCDGNELCLGVGEQATLRDYLIDSVCIFGVCYFGTHTLAKAVVGHNGAIFALASKPNNALTGLDVATAGISLFNAMEKIKTSTVTLDLLEKFCIPKIKLEIIQKFTQFRP